MNIIDFLEARIAEDEANAHAAFDATAGLEWDTGSGDYVQDYVARWQPSRGIAECAAKQAIIAELVKLNDAHEWDSFDTCVEKAIPQLLAYLARPYVEHAEFDPAWKVRSVS